MLHEQRQRLQLALADCCLTLAVRHVGSSMIAAQTAPASVAALFGVPVRRSPVFRPLITLQLYYKSTRIPPRRDVRVAYSSAS